MVEIGTVLTPVGKKALLCGSGELGKEVAIELQRYGVEVVALDKYANAPAMQVAHRSHVLSMLDGKKLREVIETERPDYIIPEVEAIATDTLVALEKEGYSVTPTATAAYLTMNREGIRRLAAEQLGLPTSPYKFASTREEFEEAVKEIGMPCVVKPIMSSSGHGQSVVRTADDIDKSWHYAQEGGRAGAGRVIGEGRARVCFHEGFAERADDFFHRGGTVGRDRAAGSGRVVVIRLLAAARKQRERHDGSTQNGNDLFQDEVLLSNFDFDFGFLFPTLHRISRGCKNEKSAYVKCV